MPLNLREFWSIGGVEVPTRIVLAPMAGVSIQAFRRQGRRFGAGLVCSEMVSAAGIEHKNGRTFGYLRVAPDEASEAAFFAKDKVPPLEELAWPSTVHGIEAWRAYEPPRP